MKLSTKTKFYLCVFTLLLLFACKQNASNHLRTEKQVLTIDTFSTYPPEIDGCGCSFSNNKSEFKIRKFIYMNDLGKISFLKINGVLTKFDQVSYQKIDSLNTFAEYESDSYKMHIEEKYLIRNSDESWLYSGIIKLSDKNGRTITKIFYGECGC